MSLTLSRPKKRGAGRVRPPVASSSGTTRRVRRVVRRVDAWTVCKVSALFYASLLVVVLVADAVLWLAATATGVMGHVDKFIAKLFALQTFHFKVGQVVRATVLGGIALVVLGTVVNVVTAVLYNLISDVVGGVELGIVEEDPTR